MRKYESISAASLMLFANSIFYPPKQWQEYLVLFAISIGFMLIILLLYNKNFKYLNILLGIFLIPYAVFKIVSLSSILLGFVADNSLILLLIFAVASVFIYRNGIKSFLRLSQLLFWIIPLTLLLFLLSPPQNKLCLFPNPPLPMNLPDGTIMLIITVFAFALLCKGNGGKKSTFLLGSSVGLVFLLFQGFIISLFSSPLIIERHPLFTAAQLAIYPIEALVIAIVVFTAPMYLGGLLLSASTPLKESKRKNVYISLSFLIAAAFLFLSQLS